MQSALQGGGHIDPAEGRTIDQGRNPAILFAEIEYGRSRLISRNGNAFATFQDHALRIGRLFPRDRVVLGGEIVCADESGRRPQFTSFCEVAAS